MNSQPKTILVTIGPTQEPLDAMRLISNRSSGELATMLALKLIESGHQVIALRGAGATAGQGELIEKCERVIPFGTTDELKSALETLATSTLTVDGVCHAAAVSDFFLPTGGSGKIPTSSGSLTLTLEPTPKILPMMRGWFPTATIIGWKFEATGDRESALAAGRDQLHRCKTNACVVNGPSYGEGFGVLDNCGLCDHLPDRVSLCGYLSDRIAVSF